MYRDSQRADRGERIYSSMPFPLIIRRNYRHAGKPFLSSLDALFVEIGPMKLAPEAS